MTQIRSGVLPSLLITMLGCQSVQATKTVDGSVDGGADSESCAASGQSCARSGCCASLADGCLVEGQDRVCLHADRPPTQGPACNGPTSSTIDGVSIVFPDDRCSFTPAELATGIGIKYQVVVAHDLTGIAPTWPAPFTCLAPDGTGFIVTGVIAGQNQRYCLCDEGRCGGVRQTTAPQAGSTDETFAWDGRNWDGPSDTNNPEGAAFPAGTYTLTLSAVGEQMSSGWAGGGVGTGAGDAGGAPFEVRATRFITIQP